MAHIEELENGKFKVVWEVGTGYQRKRKTKTFDNQKEAEVFKARKVIAKSEGSLLEPTKVTLAEYFERWLKNTKKPKVATTTYDGYENRYNAYIKPRLGDILLQKLKFYHIEDFLADLREDGAIRKEGGLSENTLKKIYVLLNQCLDKAVRQHLINENPCNSVEPPVPEEKEVVSMDKKDLKKLLDVAKNESYFLYSYILFAVLTGMRKSEMLGLEWEDVNLKRGFVSVKKRVVAKKNEGAIHEDGVKNNSSKRIVKLNERLIEVLNKLKEKQEEFKSKLGNKYKKELKKDFVFCRPDGDKYYPTTVNHKVKKLYRKANLSDDYNVHTLRHTFATLSLGINTHPKIVADILGHSTISTTLDLYSHVDLEMQENAVESLSDVLEMKPKISSALFRHLTDTFNSKTKK